MELKEPLLRRAQLFLEEGEWGRADDYCEQVLDQEPENAWAYVIKLMARLKVDKVEMLGLAPTDYEQWHSYRNACRFADEDLKKELNTYLEKTKAHIRREEQRKKEIAEAQVKEQWRRKQEQTYQEGMRHAKADADVYDLAKARVCFEKVSGYSDADAQLEDCKKRIAALKAEAELRRAREREEERKSIRRRWIIAVIALVCVVGIGCWIYGQIKASNAQKAKGVEKNLPGTIFSGTNTESVTTSGGSMRVVTKKTEYRRTIKFKTNGTVIIETKECYAKEPFIMRNGQLQWDSIRDYTETEKWSDLEVSFTGQVSVLVGSERCELRVNEDNEPTAIVMDGITYKVN